MTIPKNELAKKFLIPGQYLDLEIPRIEDQRPTFYETEIIAMDENLLYLLHPRENGLIPNIPLGIQVILSYLQKNQVWSFTTKIVRIAAKKRQLVLVLDYPEKFRQDRRRHYRLDYKLPLKLEFLDPTPQHDLGDILHVVSTDISIGGVGFSTPEHIAQDTYFEVQFRAGNKGKVQLPARCVRCIPAGIPPNQIYLVGAQFLVIDQTSEDQISSFIFSEQQQRMRAKNSQPPLETQKHD